MLEGIGLANIITATYNCLTDENPDSLLLTETDCPWTDSDATLTNYVESSLCCPISMIPTIYGYRLANHLKLVLSASNYTT